MRKNGRKMVVLDTLYDWAERNKRPDQRWSDFCRDKLVAAMEADYQDQIARAAAQQDQAQPDQPQPQPKKNPRGGKAFHMHCYGKMAEEWDLENGPIPDVTEYYSEKSSVCPKCKLLVKPHQDIVMGNPREWRLE